MNRDFRPVSRFAKIINACAAAVVAATLLGSQFLLSEHYADEGQARLAAAQSAKVAKAAASAPQPGRRS